MQTAGKEMIKILSYMTKTATLDSSGSFPFRKCVAAIVHSCLYYYEHGNAQHHHMVMEKEPKDFFQKVHLVDQFYFPFRVLPHCEHGLVTMAVTLSHDLNRNK